MNKSPARDVVRRDEQFVDKTQTRIWLEKAASDNPYITEQAFCHGYDLFDLMQNCSFVDMLFLLFRGELPTTEQKELLEHLMIGFINPGPRHAATRAAMNAGVGKTHPVHILPIATSVMGGERDCAGAIEACMRFFRKHFRESPTEIAKRYADTTWENLPGFGQAYGGIDLLTQQLAAHLCQLSGAAEIMHWGAEFTKQLSARNAGWLPIGVAAAAFADLGFHPKLGGPLYQLISAPGLLAHGFELYTKPLTAMPYVKDKDYEIEYPS